MCPLCGTGNDIDCYCFKSYEYESPSGDDYDDMVDFED